MRLRLSQPESLRILRRKERQESPLRLHDQVSDVKLIVQILSLVIFILPKTSIETYGLKYQLSSGTEPLSFIRLFVKTVQALSSRVEPLGSPLVM